MITGRRRRARARIVVSSLAAFTLLLGGATAAAADPAPSSDYPSVADIERSRAASAATGASVAAMERKILVGALQTEALAQHAAQAAESFNGAVLAHQSAQQTADTAAISADEADAEVAAARAQIGRLAAASYRAGGALGDLSLVLSADGPRELLARISTMEVIAEGQTRSLDRFTVSTVVASVLRARAETTLARSGDALDRVSRTKQRAEEVLVEARRGTAALQEQREALIGELAAAKHTTRALESARADGLAAAQAKAQREARARAIAQGQADRAVAQQRAAARTADGRRATQTADRRADQQAADRRAAAQAADRRSAPAAQAPAPVTPKRSEAASGASPSSGQQERPAAQEPATPRSSAPATSSARSRGSAAGGQAAVAFAREQLGKPYEWAAAGPESFDCSGLTMQAWAAAGVGLGHYTVSQFTASNTVSVAEARPGDLVFFASDLANPATIYHVGLYVGGEQMIEAPFTGANVKISSIYRGSLLGLGRP